MAISEEKLSVEVVLDSSGAIKGVRDLQGNFVTLEKIVEKTSSQIEQFDTNTKKAGSQASKTSSVFGGMGFAIDAIFKPVVALNQGYQLLTSTLGQLSNAVSGVVFEFAKAELAQVKLEKGIAIVGDRVNNSANAWDVYTDAIEKTTGADADLLKNLVATSLQIGLSEKQTQTLVEASIRLADVSGNEVGPTFERLLQTYKGQAKAIAIFAPEVRNLTKEQLSNGAAVDAILSKYKNVESAFNTTLSGSIRGTQIRFEDLRESIGQAIAQGINLEAGLKSLQGFFASLRSVIDSVNWSKLTSATLLFSSVVSGVAIVAISGLRIQLLSLIQTLIASSLPATIAAAKFIAIGAGIATLVIAVDIAARNLGRLSDVIKTIASAVGVGLLTAVEAAANGLAFLFKSLPGFDAIAKGLLNVSAKAKELGATLTEVGANAAENLDFGIGGTLFEEGTKALAAFNNTATQTVPVLNNLSTVSKLDDDSILDPEQLKKITDSAQKAGEAFIGFSAAVSQLQGQSQALDFENQFAKAFTATEKQYQQTLLQIEAEKTKAIASGVSLKAADELGVKTIQIAQSIEKQTENLELRKKIQDEIAANEKASLGIIEQVRTQTLQGNEELLRIGLNRQQVVDRSYQVELDNLEVLRRQADQGKKLSAIDLQQFELAQKTIEARREAAKIEATKQAGTDTAADLGKVIGSDLGSSLGQIFPQIFQNIASQIGATFAAAANVIGLVLKAPDLIAGLASFLKSLETFPTRLADAFISLVTNFGSLISNLATNISSAIPKIVDSVISLVVVEGPKLIGSLLGAFLSLVSSLIEKLPDIVTAFITYFLLNVPKIAIGLLKAVIIGIPKIIIALAKALPALIPAILTGLKEAFLGLKSEVEGLFGDGIKSGLQQSMQGFTALGSGVASQLFSVADIAAEAGAEKKAEELGNSIRQAAKDAVGIFDRIWNALKRIWSEYIFPFFDTFIIQPLLAVWEFAKVAFQAIIKAFEFLWEVAKVVFNFIIKSFETVFDFAKVIFKEIWQGLSFVWSEYIFPAFQVFVINPLVAVWNLAKIVFEVIIKSFEGMWSVMKVIFDGVLKVFAAMWSSIPLIFDGIINSFTLAWEGAKKIFSALWDAAKVIFNAPIAAFQAIWNFASTVFENPIAAFKQLWTDFKNIGQSIQDSLGKVGAAIWSAIKSQIDSAGNVFSSIGSNIGSAIANAVNSVINSLKSAFTNLNLGDAATKAGNAIAAPLRGVFDFMKSGINSFIDVLNALRLPEVKVSEKVFGKSFSFTLIPDMDLIPGTIAKFARGGEVGGSGFGDIVPAMLTPGEFVVSRPAVNKIGTSALQSINKGLMPQGDTNISLSLTLNSSERIDANYVRDKLMPAIKEELRKESRRGGYIIAASGVRA